jgi:hypothetical protein
LNFNALGTSTIQFEDQIQLNAQDLVLSGAAADIRCTAECDIYPDNQSALGFRIDQDGTQFILSGLGTTEFLLSDNLTINAANSLTIPQGTNPTVNAVGELALDTTDGQLLSATSTNPVVMARAVKRLYSFSVSSTTDPFFTGFSSGKTIGLPAETDGYTVYYVMCNVWGGTSIDINFTDTGTSDTNAVTCTSATSTQRAIVTNNTWTAGEGMSVETGTVSGTPDKLFISVYGVWTRE